MFVTKYAAKPDYRRRRGGRKGERGAGISGTSVTGPAASPAKEKLWLCIPLNEDRNPTVCGIAGIVNLDGRGVPGRVVRRMLAPLAHRGPDARGVHVDGPVGLGHVRLSIIDLAGGPQPMHYPERGLSVTFNGEIFNYIELRAELEAKGHRFRTRSDTEVILHAYEEYGDDCVEHFNGQWAFAIWDRPRRRLFLSRDRLGVRPLFYTVAKGKFLFASEVKSLFAHPDVPRADRPDRPRPGVHVLVAVGPEDRVRGHLRAAAGLQPACSKTAGCGPGATGNCATTSTSGGGPNKTGPRSCSNC